MERKYWRQVDPELVEHAEVLLAQWLEVPLLNFTFPFTGIADECNGVYIYGQEEEDDDPDEVPEDDPGCDLDWNQLSAYGLLVALNYRVFHPVGLAIARDVGTGSSPYLLVAEDGVWEYSSEVLEEAIAKLKSFELVVPFLTDRED
ncbi:DUF7415 domain-containing protein [Brucella melitensis]|uniref:DUF7415 domain-containing protein n=1 Tax=Brucella melitensis TaxID=29459 RepID=UPI0032C0E05D